MSTTKITIRPGDNPPQESVEEIERLVAGEPAFDDESPYYTKEELRIMAEKAKAKRENSKKLVVALRVSPQTLDIAKATGKGYTGFMSRLLDLAINDAEMVKKAIEG